MAYKFLSIFGLLFIILLNILTVFAIEGVRGDKELLQSESFIHDHGNKHHHHVKDGTILIPRFGRFYMFPRHETPFNPFTYKPITGNSGPGTGTNPISGTTGGRRSYIPGGDDTFIPNPGVDVPNPTRGGGSGRTTPPIGRP